MKKSITIALIIIASKSFSKGNITNLSSAPTYTKVVKSNGGLFGYKYVDETSTSNGSGGSNQILACSKPGKLKCLFKEASLGLLNQDDYDKIEVILTQEIFKTREEFNRGQFIYGDSFLVTYSYTLSSNNLVYEVYTYDEAKEAGFEF